MIGALRSLIGRAFPLALLVVGLMFTTRAGEATLRLAQDLVRGVLTMNELRSIARAVREDFVRAGRRPPLYDGDRWAAYLRDTLNARGRDNALDLWERPYGIEPGEPTYRLRSLGANGVLDTACEAEGERASITDPDAFLLRFEARTDEEAADALAELDDDLCVEVGE
jgi:hypothetical protein